MTLPRRRIISHPEYAICVAHLHVTTCIDFGFVGTFALTGLSSMVLFFFFLTSSLARFSLPLLPGTLNTIPHLQDFIHYTSMGYVVTWDFFFPFARLVVTAFPPLFLSSSCCRCSLSCDRHGSVLRALLFLDFSFS